MRRIAPEDMDLPCSLILRSGSQDRASKVQPALIAINRDFLAVVLPYPAEHAGGVEIHHEVAIGREDDDVAALISTNAPIHGNYREGPDRNRNPASVLSASSIRQDPFRRRAQ